jgi:hypothetical protein
LRDLEDFALSKEPLLTAERLRELLDYAPGTGLFYWRVSTGSVRKGTQAGSYSGDVRIRIGGHHCGAHRLAWLYVYGRHPKGVVDHINGNRFDNRIANLRECSRAENMRNLKGRGTSGFKGVFAHRKKWLARICVNRKDHYLGVFNTKEEAGAAYDAAARILHGKFARLNAKARNAKTARNDAQATRDASVRSYSNPKRLFTQE